MACWRYGRWLVRGPGYAAEGMAVPLAVKDLRPLRGAFGVLDREPLARHRQMEGQARSLPQPDAAQPCMAGRQFRICSAGSPAKRESPRVGDA